MYIFIGKRISESDYETRNERITEENYSYVKSMIYDMTFAWQVVTVKVKFYFTDLQSLSSTQLITKELFQCTISQLLQVN